MNKLYVILYVMILLVLSNLVYSANINQFCYQETANDSTLTSTNPTLANGDCGLTFDGKYNDFNDFFGRIWESQIDGDWSTSGSFFGEASNLTINYSKPNAVISNVIWQIKHGQDFGAGFLIVNKTLNSTCQEQNPIQLKITGGPTAVDYINASCWNGTDYTIVHTNVNGNAPTLFEEAIWWNISIGVDDCTSQTTPVLRINGKDEEKTSDDVNTTLNIFLNPVNGTGTNSSFSLSGSANYTFCSDRNLTIDSIMEYEGGNIFTHRKYYLNNVFLNTNKITNVTLYHLNNSKASEIVFTVFDTTTGDRVKGAFIKVLRYYPGENVFRIVEIAKTDEVGQTLGKMVLADVFYKFIIEAPAGTVKLDTGVLRILSLTRSFGISFVVDVLDTWKKIHGVSFSTTCTKGTQTCRITWSDESNIVQDVTLEVWRINGLTDKLLFSQTIAAASGTISYIVTEDTATNRYVARGFIESNTGTSRYPGGTASFFYSDNPFFTDEAHRLASLFPLLLLVIVIVFALVDWGVIGIVIGALLGLILGSIVGILPLSPFYFVSFIIMGVILLYKLSK